MTHIAHQGRAMTPYATATTHPDPMGITAAIGGHKSRPRAAAHREIGGRQDRDSIGLWVLSVVSFESKECPIYPKGAPPQRAIGQLW